jgi:hypothetical protein
VTLDDLPTLTIASIGEQGAEAVWSDPKWIGERHIVCIVSDSDKFIWGRLSSVDTRQSQCVFTPDDPIQLAKLEIGRAYPQLDGYWGERAELVFNRSLLWREREYQPTDAVRERSGTMRPFSGAVPAGGVLVKGGWDHEHCAICWETISQKANPIGLHAAPDHWICKGCYQRFVQARSLDFIVDAPDA